LGKLTLVLGGARSGKSSFAESLANKHGGSVTYVATAQALDEEMAERIARHRQDRPDGWATRELALGVGENLLSDPPHSQVILVDCLTLLVSNLLMESSAPDGEIDEDKAAALVKNEIDRLVDAVHASQAGWIVVSNEVGMGLVPPYPLGRIYRDLLGWANQRLASHADQVIFMIAGIPMRLVPMNS
jgi:adenosylcobinamide kinase/adenosylcobinamide-phosphate guanylyltransferase